MSPYELALAAARRHGLAPEVVPVREGANAVFRAGDVLIRVAPPGADVAGQVACARQLAAAGVRVPRPLAAERDVSLWEYLEPDDGPVDYEQLGALVARLHGLEPFGPLPFCGEAEWLDVEARAVAPLEREAKRFRGWQDRARAAERVLCHGDVHPLNVLMHAGEVVLLDWDTICLGP